MKVAIFARVSDESKQDNSRQVNDLKELCKQQGWEVVAVITEETSGATSNDQREGVAELLSLAASGRIDKVVISEISRLGRKVSAVLELIETLAEFRVSIYVGNIGMETLKPNGLENFMFKPILITLAGFAEMERELLRERILSGMKEARRKGKRIGRPAGPTDDDLLEKYPKVTRHLKSGRSIRETAKLADVSPATVQKVKKAMIEIGMK